MSGFRKWVWLAVVTVVLVIGLSWAGFFRAFSPPLVKFTPGRGHILAESKPVIKGSWTLFPFATLKISQIVLDGQEITTKATVSGSSFSYLPADELEEGQHHLEIRGKYHFFLTKPLVEKTDFIVDTVLPSISLNGDFDLLASSGPRTVVGGKSEPGSRLTITFNDYRLPTPKLYDNGSFWLGINLKRTTNTLKIKAIDKAGNRSTRSFRVLIDTDNPQIVAFSPSNSTSKRPPLKTCQPPIEIEIDEKTSAIDRIRIWIDDVEHQATYDDSTKRKAVVKPEMLAEGSHTVKIRAIDLARNYTTFTWSFTIDSTDTLGGNLIYPGATGADVKELQARLMAMGFGPKWASGVYKEETIDAVKALQQSKGLPVTGRVDAAELALIKPQKLDTSRGPLPGARLELSVSKRSLTLYEGDILVKVYPIAVGMGGRFATPIGHFYIKKKEVNPTWYPPDWADTSEPVRPGPNNPLGNRRLLLNITAYGIHGTNKPSSIGKAVTHGCIRMYPSDILELYELVAVGTKVNIIR